MFREFSDNSRSEEFLNEFRQKMADQTVSNIEERQNELRRSKSVFVGTLAGLVLAGMIGGFVLAPHYNKNFTGDVPVIKGPAESVKTAPADRGGMTVENQDKSVYEILDSNAAEVEVVETIVSAPEEPKMPEVVAVEETYSPATIDEIIKDAGEEVLNDASKVLTGRVGETSEEASLATDQTVESIAEVNPASREKMDEIKAQVDTKIREVTVEEVTPTEEKVQKVVETVQVITEDTIPVSKTAATSGDWQIQIMSSPNRESVEKSWKDLQAKHTFFAGLPYEIEKADLGASGIYYRLKVGAFTDKSAAEAVCEKYKAEKGSCLVKKK